MTTRLPTRHRERPVPATPRLAPRRRRRSNAPATVSATNHAEALLAQAPLKERKLRRQIARARTPKERNKAQHRHLRSFHVRVAAVMVAARKKHRNLSPAEVICAAKHLSLDLTHPVRPVLVPKVSGGVRVAWAYGVEGRAVQEITRWQLSASAQIPEWQYALGGRSTRDLVDDIARDLRNGARWVLVADMENCYPSFDAGRLAAVLPIPSRLALSALAGERQGAISETTPGSRPGNYLLTRQRWRSHLVEYGSQMTVAEDALESPNRLFFEFSHDASQPNPASATCQGSAAAPLSVSIALGDLDRLMPAGVTLRAWSDNFVVTARTRRGAERAREVLHDALRQSPLGRLRLGYAVVRRRDWGFNIFGFHVRTRRDRTVVSTTPSSKANAFLRAGRAAGKDVRAGDPTLPKTRQSLRGWVNYYRGCPGVETVAEQILDYAQGLAELALFDEPPSPPPSEVSVPPPRVRRRQPTATLN